MSAENIDATTKVNNAELGARTLIAGVGLYDTPEPGAGHLLAWAGFPGDGKVAFYPGCMSINFPPKSIEISLDHGTRARPTVACISLEGDQLVYHPPADRPELLAIARLCERFGIPFSAPDAAARLSLELARLYEPDAFTPAGRELTPEERRISIAWVVDQEQREGETIPSVLSRIKQQLLEHGLI